MQFDTKIAVIVRTDLEPWQKLNVASFLSGGIAAAFPGCVGEAYEDGSGTKYLSLIGQPILIYGADRAALSRALERALARNVMPAVYTEDMFRTTHDEANRAAVKNVGDLSKALDDKSLAKGVLLLVRTAEGSRFLVIRG